MNKDIIGWIYIPDTNINYPVLKATDNNYYLTHNFKKETSHYGCIFMDYRNTGTGTDKNTIIYGHNMKDGSMFATLMNYKNKEFIKSHPIIEFDTLDKEIKWQVFSVYVTNTSFYYIKTDFAGDKDFEQLINQMKSKSLFNIASAATVTDNILTLSTCSYEFENARFVVQAKKIN